MADGRLDEEDLLVGTAQLGCAFVGFCALFVTLQPKSGFLAPMDWLHLRIVLELSCVTVILSIVPCSTWYFKFHGGHVWRMSSVVLIAASLAYVGSIIYRAPIYKIDIHGLVNNVPFLLTLSPIAVAVIIALCNVGEKKGGWPRLYLFSLFMFPLAVLVNFFILISSTGIASRPATPEELESRTVSQKKMPPARKR